MCLNADYFCSETKVPRVGLIHHLFPASRRCRQQIDRVRAPLSGLNLDTDVFSYKLHSFNLLSFKWVMLGISLVGLMYSWLVCWTCERQKEGVYFCTDANGADDFEVFVVDFSDFCDICDGFSVQIYSGVSV